MSKKKKVFIQVCVFIILILGIWFAILDFSRFIGLKYYYGVGTSYVLKRIAVVLAAAIAWAVGKDGFDDRDSRLMKVVFIAVCCGELAFFLNRFDIGIGFFAVCQTILIIRNGKGLKRKLEYANCGQKGKLKLAAAIILMSLAAVAVIFYPVIRNNKLILLACLYGLILGTSLWTGIANWVLGLFPEINSKMTVWGMLCFYCCDILVGPDAIMNIGFSWLIVNSLIWVFYTPALTLLALSCYRYKQRF
jgi:hypothetical protein